MRTQQVAPASSVGDPAQLHPLHLPPFPPLTFPWQSSLASGGCLLPGGAVRQTHYLLSTVLQPCPLHVSLPTCPTSQAPWRTLSTPADMVLKGLWTQASLLHLEGYI